MATVGNSSTPTFGWFQYGINTFNGVAVHLNMPSTGGLISDIHAYFSTYTGTGTCYTILWDNNGNVLASVSERVGAGSASAGGQGWRGGTLATPVWLDPSVGFFLGFECPQANGLITSFYNSGSSFNGQGSSLPYGISSWPGTGHGAIGAYATYTTGGGGFVKRSDTMTQASTYVKRGGVWVPAPAYVMRSNTWTLTS